MKTFRRRLLVLGAVFFAAQILIGVADIWLNDATGDQIFKSSTFILLAGVLPLGVTLYFAKHQLWDSEKLKLAYAKSLNSIVCPKCSKHLPINKKWICTRCDTENEVTRLSDSFVGECPHCGLTPEAVECPHCEKISLFEKTGSIKFPAKYFEIPAEEEPIESTRARDLAELDFEEQLTMRREKVLKAHQSLKATQQKDAPPPPKKSKTEQVSEHLNDFMDEGMSVDNAYGEMRQRIDAECANNPSLKKRRIARLDQWRDEVYANPFYQK
jgi:DNA-directed RNA polymerase subunit RPC12/RpoP